MRSFNIDRLAGSRGLVQRVEYLHNHDAVFSGRFALGLVLAAVDEVVDFVLERVLVVVVGVEVLELDVGHEAVHLAVELHRVKAETALRSVQAALISRLAVQRV